MQDIDTKKYYDTEFKSIEQLKNALEQEQGTTLDIDFILGVREMLLSDNLSITDVDTLLWGLMRDHHAILHKTSGMDLLLVSCRVASVIWFNKLVDNADLSKKDAAGYNVQSHAIMGGSLMIVEKLAEKGVEFCKSNKDSKSYLLEAATSKNANIFKWLLEQETDDKTLEEALIDFVINHDKPDIVGMMIDKGVKYQECNFEHKKQTLNALEIALLNKRYDTAKLLIEHGMAIQHSDLPTSFSTETAEALLTALHADKHRDDLSIPEKIAYRLSSMLISEAINKDKSLIYSLAGISESNETLKMIFAIADINPALDVELDAFDETTQERIYEIMFI